MTIDIKRTVLRTQLRRFLSLIFFTAALLAVILISSFTETIIGLNKSQLIWLLIAVYVLYLFVESFLEFNYIYFSDDGTKLVLRYFSMSIFNRKKNSIVISKDSFSGYEVIETLKGFKKKIIVFEKINDKSAKYPPVSITGLNKEEMNALLRTLDKYK